MRLHLIRDFLDRGIEVDLIVADPNSPYMDIIDPRAHVVRLRTSHALTAVPAMVRYLLKRRPDVMLTQRIRVNIVALRARRIARVKTRIFATFNTHVSARLSSLPESKAERERQKLRRYYPRNDGLIAISRGVAEDAASLVGVAADRIPVIYNPVVTPQLFEQAEQPLDDPWFEDPETPVILGVGRLEPPKNFHDLIDAYAKIRAKRQCRLVILGEGKNRNDLVAQVNSLGLQDDVRLTGFVSNPYRYMRRAAVFALASSWEGLGNALIESMAVGTPVVATDCPSGPREILEGGKHGRLVPVNDPDALADAIIATLDSPPDRESLRRAASRFEAGASARRYLEVMGLV
jgi:glycosyltransferase involved in cell wall biosynthesis